MWSNASNYSNKLKVLSADKSCGSPSAGHPDGLLSYLMAEECQGVPLEWDSAPATEPLKLYNKKGHVKITKII